MGKPILSMFSSSMDAIALSDGIHHYIIIMNTEAESGLWADSVFSS